MGKSDINSIDPLMDMDDSMSLDDLYESFFKGK